MKLIFTDNWGQMIEVDSNVVPYPNSRVELKGKWYSVDTIIYDYDEDEIRINLK